MTDDDVARRDEDLAHGDWHGDRQGDGQAGFTLIELLVVMIIISVLAAIAVPAVITQRGKAQDTVTRSDARNLAQAVHGWFLESSAAPSVQIVAGRFEVGGADVAAVSDGVQVDGADPAVVDTTGWTRTTWCLGLTNPSGAVQTFKVSAQQGLESGACSSSGAP
jgi:prepilin-type N-terminal cleavage/methylation domain-containing protein